MNKNEILKLLNNSTSTIFEVGCADGGDTQDFVDSLSSQDYRLFCFEPEQTNIEIFKKRNFNERVKLFEGVVSDKTGETTFNRSRNQHDINGLRYSGSIKEPTLHKQNWPHILFDETCVVKSTTLDDFINSEKINIIDFMWADVQGAEDMLIRGGNRCFDKVLKFFYTEYSPIEYYKGALNKHNIQSLLGNNWELVEDFGSDALFRNKNL